MTIYRCTRPSPEMASDGTQSTKLAPNWQTTVGVCARQDVHLDLCLDNDVVMGRQRLPFTLLDIARNLIETRSDVASLPSGESAIKHIVHLLECSALCLGCT